MSYIGANDLVFNNNKVDGIFGGGFSVNSIMMKGGISPIMTLNTNNTQNGGSADKVSDIFGGLAVPAYAYYNGGFTSKHTTYKSNDSDSEDEVIDDDLHDKLLGLVREHDNKLKQEERKKKRTRKHTRKTNRVGTRKNFRKEESPIE
jgi:hypothetical protein